MAQITVVNDTTFNNGPSLTQLADATYICIYRKGTDIATSGDGALVYRFSADAGQTWSAETVFISASSFDNQRVGIVAIGASKVLVSYSQLTVSTSVYRSYVTVGTVNGGRTSITFDTAVQIGSSSATPYNFVCGQPLLLANASILVPGEFLDSGQSNFSCAVISVTVSGTTPTPGSRVTIAASTGGDSFNQGCFVQIAGGRVICFMCRTEGSPRGYARSQSDDDGATWASPVNVMPGSNVAGATASYFSQPAAVARNSSIWMMFKYHVDSGDIQSAYYAKALHDQGNNWSDPILYDVTVVYQKSSGVLQANNKIGFVLASLASDTDSYIIYDEFPGSDDPFAAGYDPADNTVTRVIVSDNSAYDYTTNHTVSGENLILADSTEGTDIYSVQALVDLDNP